MTERALTPKNPKIMCYELIASLTVYFSQNAFLEVCTNPFEDLTVLPPSLSNKSDGKVIMRPKFPTKEMNQLRFWLVTTFHSIRVFIGAFH